MRNVIIQVRTSDGAILGENKQFGITGENYQGNLIFQLDKPIDGSGTILVEINGDNFTVAAISDTTKTEYSIPILNTLLVQSGLINVQLRITQTVQDEHIPVFMSQVATGYIPVALDGPMQTPEEYSTWMDTIDSLRTDVSNINTEIGEITGDISGLDTRLDTAEDDIVSLKGRVSTNEDDISSLKNRMTTTEGDIDSLEGRMLVAEGNINDLQSDMRTAKSNISTLQSKVQTLESKVQTLENKVQTLENKVQTIESYDYIIVEGE